MPDSEEQNRFINVNHHIMKKVLLCLSAVFLVGICQCHAQYPIPSYDVCINDYATFQEDESEQSPVEQVLAKRMLYIRASCGNKETGTCQATVWFYSLDRQTVYGPFTIYGDETIPREIDQRAWGVLVESEDGIYIDVWIEEE